MSYSAPRFALCFLLFCATGSGCTKMLNGGYETDFTECPRADNGQCMSVEDAHESASEATYGGAGRRGGGGDRYDASYYGGAFPTGDAENSSQKPLEVLIDELKQCAEAKDSKCVASREKEIEAYNRKSEDRTLARRRFKEDLENNTLKMASLITASNEGETPMRTEDRYMELTMLPYKTDTGAMASTRKYWFVVEEGEWGFGPLGQGDGSGRTIGVTGRSALTPMAHER
ncbi:MAG: TraV family lipoprotein [Desulfovibrio sp.]|jgi:hypothetical protein|nr:TraV family lipoprotein [Desulfovibrio sp.]